MVPSIGMRSLVVAALCLLLAAAGSRADFTDEDGLKEGQCYSTSFRTVSKVRVYEIPRNGTYADLVFFPYETEMLHLSCVEFFEDAMVPALLTPAQRAACRAPSTAGVRLCSRQGTEAWDCMAINDYIAKARIRTSKGGRDGITRTFKLQWRPVTTLNSVCYPLDVTLQTVVSPDRPQSASVSVSIIVIIAVALFLVAVLGVGLFALNKKLKKHSHSEDAERPPPTADDLRPRVARALGFEATAPAGAPPSIDLYGEHEPTDPAEVDLGDITVQAHALPKPWYERHVYAAGHEARDPSEDPMPPPYAAGGAMAEDAGAPGPIPDYV